MFSSPRIQSSFVVLNTANTAENQPITDAITIPENIMCENRHTAATSGQRIHKTISFLSCSHFMLL